MLRLGPGVECGHLAKRPSCCASYSSTARCTELSLHVLFTILSTLADHVHVAGLAPGASHQPAAVDEYHMFFPGPAVLLMTEKPQQAHGYWIQVSHVHGSYRPEDCVRFAAPTGFWLLQSCTCGSSPQLHR
eukprot:jgi/Chrpa1/17633/Chrysochromulina_OHIO_Genome00021672-RA